MPTRLNESFMDSSNDIVDIFLGINSTSNNTLSIGILLTIWIIMVMVLYERGVMEASFFASFLITILSILFLGIGLLGSSSAAMPIVGVCVALTIITGFLNWMVK